MSGESAKKDVQVNVGQNLSTAVIQGIRVRVGPDSNVVVYTNSEVQKMPASGEAAAKGTFISEDFNTVVLKGVMIECAPDGGVVVHTDGTLKVRSTRMDNSSAPKVLPRIGDVRTDGTFYAGISSETGEALYVAPADEMEDGTIFAGISPDTGRPMYVTPADAPLVYTFNQAQKYVQNLDAHGHKDWRVPTKGELNVLFQNRAAIGGFDRNGEFSTGWYRAAPSPSRRLFFSSISSSSCSQRFSDGAQVDYNKASTTSLRCVRG
jgi:hypothetical protein